MTKTTVKKSLREPVFQAIRYLRAFELEKRRNHHKSIPGILVAETLRYLELATPGINQAELEEAIISGSNGGAKWRAYTARRNRSLDERQECRLWHGRHGGKPNSINLEDKLDDFFEQTHLSEPTLPPSATGQPGDGRAMSFSTMRMAISSWVAVAVHQEMEVEIKRAEQLGNSRIKSSELFDNAETSDRLIKRILWIQCAFLSLRDEINAWEAANETISEAGEIDGVEFLYYKFRTNLIKIKKREHEKSMSCIKLSKLR